VAEHSAKGPSGSGDIPVINVDEAQWRQIEKASGSSIPPNLRAAIVRATEAFIFLQSFEGTPKRKAEVKVILEAHDKAATRFFNELFADASATSDAGVYAHFLIEAHFKSSRLRENTAGLDVLLDGLRTFHIACNAAIKQLNDPSTSALRNEDGWKTWINRLVDILMDAEPIRRHEFRKSNSATPQHPFVLLICELQKCLPAKWHDARSEVTLAGAISEALSLRNKSQGRSEK
jgi:hypothetical protein